MSVQTLTRLFAVPLLLTIPPTAIVAALFYFSVFGSEAEILMADRMHLMLRWPLAAIYLWAMVWAVFSFWRLRRCRKELVVG